MAVESDALVPMPSVPDAPPAAPEGPTTLASQAEVRLRQDIIRAVWLPGEKLQIGQLCTRYEVGSSPMREALNRLARDGLVTHNEQRGFRVAPVGEADVLELNKTRGWLNEIGLRESMSSGGSAWEERVLLASHRLSRTPRRLEQGGDVNPEWERMHRAFHAALVSACGSHWLTAYCEQLFDAAERYRHLSRLSGERNEARARDQHQAITQAILSGNADQAVRLLLDHFDVTAQFVKASLALPVRQGATADRDSKAPPAGAGGIASALP